MSVDMELLLDSVKHVESRGNPNAVSPKGAQGPYQFMPDTAAEYGVKNPFNETEARDGARRYLKDLMGKFNGDAEMAVAAYNGGPGRLAERGSISTMPAETQKYTNDVMTHYGNLVLASGNPQFDHQDQQPASAVDSLFPGAIGNRQRKVGGDLSSLFPNNHEDDVLSASVLDPKPIDQASRIYNMQLRTGLPTGLIERNLDEIEKKASAEDFDPESFRRDSPLLAQWLSQNPVKSSLAQGDYENLSALEKSWASLKAIPSGFNQGIDTERSMTLGYKAVTGTITPQEEIERQKLKQTMQDESQQNQEGLPSYIQSAAQIVGVQVPMTAKAVEHGVLYGMPAGAAIGATAGLLGGPGAFATVPGGAALGAAGGLSSGFYGSYIDQTYKLSVGDAYDDLEGIKDASGNPINPTVARYAALVAAVPNSLLEFASLRASVKLIPGVGKVMGKFSTDELKKILIKPTVMEAFKDFGKKYVEAVGTESFTEGMQKFVNIVTREIATGDNGAGVTKADAKAILAESTNAFKGTLILGALASGPKVIELYADMEKAAQNEQFMRALGDTANSSETFKNSPKAFGDYVKYLKDNDQTVKNVFVPIDSWNALFQDGAPHAAKEVFGDSKQYEEAQATGSDLVIPIETYAEKLAGTQFHEELVPHIRLNPGEMTPTEAAMAEKSEPLIQAGLEKELEAKVAEEKPLATVYQDVYGKLIQSGSSEQEAVRDATLWRERIRARADRLGIDPAQLYNENPLTVVREFPSGPGVLEQKERGASVPIQNMIALLKGADASTFAHESGHIWLEELKSDAMRPDAPEQLKNDWQTIKDWSGATDEAIPKESHETFARGFEAYLREGKAPSFQLRRVFAQLKDWLSRIYKSMDMLDVQLTPDVRDVMDRLIATDDAIKQAHERNGYDVKMFNETDMSGDEYAAYNQLAEEAKMKAEDNFRAKIMKELRREKTQAWRDEKKALEPVVREEILAQPLNRAAYWLHTGLLPDGTKIDGMSSNKLNTQSLKDMGVDPKDLPFRYSENGLHPDVVAQMFGYPSGESLVRDLIGLPTLKSTIDNEVSSRIREKHGGIIVEGTSEQEVAMEVQNTQQVDMFNMELRVLKRMGATREITHTAVMKDIAQQIISRKTLGELDPRVFEEAALRASQEAQDHMLGREFRSGTGRNLDKAFDAKQKQMLNVFLFKEASEQRQMADKTIKVWKKMLFRSDERLAKTHDMNMVNAARAIASVHGLGGSAGTAASYMRALAQYDPQSYDDMREVVDLASSDGRQMDDLTVADFSIVRDSINGLMALARRSRQVEIDGKKMEKDEVVGRLNARIGELVPSGKAKAGYKKDMTKWDKTKMNFLGAFAMLKRVEHWVDAMDNGDPNGAFRSFIWQPISEAADIYRDNRRLTLEKYQAIAKSVPKETFRTGKIDATEIQYEFANKTTLIGALLHTGNQSNLRKLLLGREWGTINSDGELDSRNWDTFIKRMQDQGVITKADYDFVQSVWGLFDEIKPEAQKAHKEMYGYFFDEVTAQPFTNKFGIYKGGYYPAIVDPYIVQDANIRAEQQALESQPSSFMFPTTGRGFTKKRSEMYTKPLSLDVGLIQNSLEKVLRFTHLEPRVKDIGRVAIDKNFRAHLEKFDSEVGTVMLMPWLQRSAQQMVEQPSGPRMRGLDSFFHAVRANTGLQIISANVSVALQQLSGMSLSMLKVKPSHMAGALWRYTSSPRAYADHVNESSVFMRNRLSTQTMDIRRSIDNIMLNPSAFKKVKDFANEHGYFMQTATQNIVDMVTWGGAYEQATRAGSDEKSAVRQADSAVRETQGTFHAEDISRFETGTAFKRCFTMFYSYFNMAANLNATEFTKAMRSNGFAAGGRALYVYALGFMIPAVLSEAITQAVSGEAFDDDDDDGYLDNILSIFFGGQAKMATAMVPIIGPVVQAGINMYNKKWYDDSITASPAISSMGSVAATLSGYNAYKLATKDEASLKRPIRDALTTIGMVTGLPVAPLGKPIGYLTDIQQGKVEEPNNPLELARGLISGKAPK